MAKTTTLPDDTSADPALPIKVRVLSACAYGACNAVAVIPAGELAEAKANGLVDDDPAAVDYAESLQA